MSLFEAWDGSVDAPTQRPSCLCAVLFVELLCEQLNFLDVSSHVVPLRIASVPMVFAVNPEVGVVLAFNQEVPSLVAVSSPRLYRKRLVLVVGVACLLVRVFDPV